MDPTPRIANMQRPVMDPTFVEEIAPARRRFAIWKPLLRAAAHVGRSLRSNPLVLRRPDQPRTPIGRVIGRTVVCWGLLLPLLTGVTAVLLVIAGTHPTRPPTVADPNSEGCYFESVRFGDGDALSGWIVPALDADRVMSWKDRLLRSRQPGVVLVHDYGQSAQQMLPLVRPLHQDGFNVLVLQMRGDATDQSVATTFGIRESAEVAAAVNFLKGRLFVDPNRIALVGIGTGGSAALLAASRDPSIRTVVAAGPLRDCDQAIAKWIAPPQRAFAWMEPVCRWTFELMCDVHAADLDSSNCAAVLQSSSTLLCRPNDPSVLADRTNVDQIARFCRVNLTAAKSPSVASAR